MDDNGIKAWTDKGLIYWEFLQKMTQVFIIPQDTECHFLGFIYFLAVLCSTILQKTQWSWKIFYSNFDKMNKLWKLDLDFICKPVRSKIPFEKLVAHSLSIYLKRESKQKCWKLNGEVLPRLKFCLIARTGASVGIR